MNCWNHPEERKKERTSIPLITTKTLSTTESKQMITIVRSVTNPRNHPLFNILNHNRSTIQNRTIIGANTSKKTSSPIICRRMMEEERGGTGSGFANGGGSSMSGVRVSNGKEVEGQGVVAFPLSPASAMKIQKGDITRWSVDGSSDAIVNPANELMLGGGGADGAIHRAAGPELREACYNVPEVRPGVRCPTGEARITPGFRLPASHVIHTVGPVYDVDLNPEASLRSAYRNSMLVAKEKNIQYIAFTAISCGVFRYPLDEAATVAIQAIKEFANDFKEVHFVLFSDDIYKVWLNKAGELLGN